MNLHFGSENDVATLVKTHLFVICANNSGSTFLKKALSTSKRTWNLVDEGQHTFGFSGPNTRALGAAKRWAGDPQFREIFSDGTKYDWTTIKKAWYFQSFSRDPKASVFVEKSPPWILIVDQLFETFENAKFLFMVRNPYAVVEGIKRNIKKAWKGSVSESKELTLAAKHVVTTMEFQIRNVGKFGNYGVSFLYEEMCSEPEKITEVIQDLVPELDDLVLNQRISVKNYDEELRNMNAQQIARLTNSDLDQINRVFRKHRDIIEFFGYSILE